ncbi:aryl-sulfate sulfotransferase [Niveibacterium sp.]|uniref:aryl-sulfate sulfotransferase n=1 Tax=Niveibacterium sp. TaxID=2017444 RepID=UPI0035B127D8
MIPFHRILPSSWLVLISLVFVAGCGGGDGGPSQEPVAPAPIASSSDVAMRGTQQGVTPFIHFVRLQGASLAKASRIQYTIAQKEGAASKPVHVSYTYNYLLEHGYLLPEAGSATIPIFGLYANYDNVIEVEIVFSDDSVQAIPVSVRTAAYNGHLGLYSSPRIYVRRAPGQQIGFDYFYVKSAAGSPVVIDTDGELRWAAVVPTSNSQSSVFNDGNIIIGDRGSKKFWRLGLDGVFSEAKVLSESYANFHHNIDVGKYGYLAEVDVMRGSLLYQESTVAEIAESGHVLKEWDLSAIISDYMREHGDDFSLFARNEVDWFHVNASAYDASDNSIVVSSRENFIIKIDYDSGRPIWILGDPTKYWYQFPSLRALALSVGNGGHYPVGQHAISVPQGGRLMLFNNGAPSFNTPAGAPVGESRSYSLVSTYRIDKDRRSATEEVAFDYGRSILSDICSSAYGVASGSMLISYATAENRTKARLVGLDDNGKVVFDFEYVSSPCQVSWNAVPIDFDRMTFK